MISYNTTGIANPTCTRLEPPVTWLAASGARVKVLHSGGSSELENLLKLDLNQPISCNSIIEVSVSKSFAESSLRTLRNKGFTREDIYRMLDKGPWVLAFDISSALPRLFASLQVGKTFSSLPAVPLVIEYTESEIVSTPYPRNPHMLTTLSWNVGWSWCDSATGCTYSITLPLFDSTVRPVQRKGCFCHSEGTYGCRLHFTKAGTNERMKCFL